MTKKIWDYMPYYIGQECRWGPKSKDGYYLDYYFAKITYQLSVSPPPRFPIPQPILRKLSDMTEEEAKELLRIRHPKGIYERHSSLCIDYYWQEGHLPQGKKYEYQMDLSEATPDQFHYLLSRGFDLFGLCEAGLAIDKSTLK